MPLNEQLYLGLDIGGSKSAAIVGTGNGRILDRRQWPSEVQRGPRKMIDDLCARGLELTEIHRGIVAVGAVVGGPLDALRGIVLSPPNLPGWDRIPLKSILEDRLKIPARIEHDAAACCLAEYTWGAGKGTLRLIYLTCGTGFGAGIVIDGAIYRGAGGASVEIGHARFRDDGPEAFGKRGSVEAFCAGASLGKLASWRFPDRWPTPPAGSELAQLQRAGDRDATAILELNADAVGEVCANLADALRPDSILLGSLSMHLGSWWVDRVRRRFAAEALSSCRIEPAGLGANLQDCSALVVAVSTKA